MLVLLCGSYRFSSYNQLHYIIVVVDYSASLRRHSIRGDGQRSDVARKRDFHFHENGFASI